MKSYVLLLMLFVATEVSPKEAVEDVSFENRTKAIEDWNKEQIELDEIEYRNKIVSAIMSVESNNDITAHNLSEDAVSLLQIRKIVVDDLNQFAGYKKYSYKDRWNREKSIKMFWEYQSLWNKNITLESCSKIWNGGPRGELKPSTEKYYTKVLQKFLIS